jgi:hypothetical protein
MGLKRSSWAARLAKGPICAAFSLAGILSDMSGASVMLLSGIAVELHAVRSFGGPTSLSYITGSEVTGGPCTESLRSPPCASAAGGARALEHKGQPGFNWEWI